MSRLKQNLSLETLTYFMYTKYGNVQYATDFINKSDKYKSINDFIIDILNFYYDDIKIDNIESNINNTDSIDQYRYHKYSCNEKYKGICLDNITLIDFYSIYPRVIIKLFRNGKLKINIPEFIDIYEFILTYYKGMSIQDSKRFILKTFINYFHNLLFYEYSYIKVDNPYLIINHIDDFYKNLHDKYNKYYLFHNIDRLYINGYNEELNNEINNFDVPYDIELDDASIIYYYPNKYILLSSNNKVEYKGLSLKNPEYLDTLKLIKNIRRKNKINKLINANQYR